MTPPPPRRRPPPHADSGSRGAGAARTLATTAHDVRVELAGHVLPLAALRARPELYRAWFAQARRSPGYARCLCTRVGQRLVIREVAGRFHLARWPDTADHHTPGCAFFSTASCHTGARAHRDAITVTEHGTRIAVDVAFTSTVASPDADPGAGSDDNAPTSVAALLDGARPTAATVTTLGLLHWLWEFAGLSAWPGPSTPARDGNPRRAERRWDDCSAALTPLVATLRLGEDAAARRLHVIAPYRPDPSEAAAAGAGEHAAAGKARDARLASFLRPLEEPETVAVRAGPRRGHVRQVRHRRLLLGELKDLTPTAHGHKLALRHFPRPLFLADEQHTHLARTYPAAFSERRGPRARRVVLALVEGTPHGYLRLVDAAVMLTAASYIPADSSYEVTMTDALIEAGRAFFKPLRYGGDGVHPDFVLTDDTGPATIVEVWGVTGRASYEARKWAKQAHYRGAGVPVISWQLPGPIPRIPAAPALSIPERRGAASGADHDPGPPATGIDTTTAPPPGCAAAEGNPL